MSQHKTHRSADANPLHLLTDFRSVLVEEVMTILPITIDEEADLVTARKIMREKGIRHLPVLHRGKLTGMLSDRDTRLVSLLPDIGEVKVGDIMTPHPQTVLMGTPVLEAVSEMAAKKWGALIVTGSLGQVTGIFTSQDALELLTGERGLNLPAPTGYPVRDCEDLQDERPEGLG